MDINQMAAQFRSEIQAKRAAGGRWVWERLVPGPIAPAAADQIAAQVGCWVYDPDDNPVRFYTNANHPRWR